MNTININPNQTAKSMNLLLVYFSIKNPVATVAYNPMQIKNIKALCWSSRNTKGHVTCTTSQVRPDRLLTGCARIIKTVDYLFPVDWSTNGRSWHACPMSSAHLIWTMGWCERGRERMKSSKERKESTDPKEGNRQTDNLSAAFN